MSNNIIKTQKYRVRELTSEQEYLFYMTVGACRWYWNTALTDNQWIYHNMHLSIIPRPAEYKTEAEWLKTVDSLALCNTQQSLEKAFKNHCKHPKMFGLPKPKSKKKDLNGKRGYTTNNVNNSIRLETTNHNNPKYSTSIRLPKMGLIPIIYHKTLPEDAIIKNVNISENADGSKYVAITYETNKPDPSNNTNNSSNVDLTKRAVGLDYSSPDLFYDHRGAKPSKTGETINVTYNTLLPKKELEQLSKKISRASKALSRKEYGSKNYYKQKKKLAKLYAKQKHIREDYQHKLSCEITNHYDYIFVEDLNLKSIASRRSAYNLGRATFGNAWGGLIDKLSYKAVRKGKVFLKVDRFFASSQTCSQCGHKLSGDEKLSLSDRVFHCPECGAELHRDKNAALNILLEGLRLVVSESVGFEVGLSCVREWWLLAQDGKMSVTEPVGRGGLLVSGSVRPVLSSLIDYARLDNLAILDHDVADGVSFGSIVGKQEKEIKQIEDKELTLYVNSS